MVTGADDGDSAVGQRQRAGVGRPARQFDPLHQGEYAVRVDSDDVHRAAEPPARRGYEGEPVAGQVAERPGVRLDRAGPGVAEAELVEPLRVHKVTEVEGRDL